MISLTGRPPSDVYDLIVVSPHMDDAAYCMGGRIVQARRQHKRVLVVTLFGPGTNGVAARGIDVNAAPRQADSEPRATSLRSSDVVADAKASLVDYASRCAEEAAGLGALDVDSVWLDVPELVFRRHSAPELMRLLLPIWSLPWSALHDLLTSALSELCKAHLAEQGSIVFPLAVGFHPDHRVACDVGRALNSNSPYRVEFYEDIPYNHARPLRALRLRSLGLPAPLSLVAGTSDIMRVMGRASRLLRWGSYLPLLSYLFWLALLQRAFSLRDLGPGEAAPERAGHDIADAIDEKVTAMRLYASQTSMFFGEGAAIYSELNREHGYEEISWKFAPAQKPAR